MLSTPLLIGHYDLPDIGTGEDKTPIDTNAKIKKTLKVAIIIAMFLTKFRQSIKI